MRIIIFFCILLIAPLLVVSQSQAIKSLQYWETNYKQTNQLYLEISDLINNQGSDSLIFYKSLNALNCIKLGIAHCEMVKQNDKNYTADANYLITLSCLQGAWINQTLEEENDVFTDSLARFFIKKCFLLRPTVTEIPYYELNFKLDSVEDFEQLYFDQVFLSFLHAVEDNDTNTIRQRGKEYIDDMYFVYQSDFPVNIFIDQDLQFEQSRIYTILNQLIPVIENKSEKLNLQVLLIEFLANLYFENHLLDNTFMLFPEDRDIINKMESEISENMYHSLNPKDLYLRLADAYFLLGRIEKGVEYYSLGVLNINSNIEELKNFIEINRVIVDTTTNIELSSLIKDKVRTAALLYLNNSMFSDDIKELNYLYETFIFVGDEQNANAIQLKIRELEENQAKIEKINQRREKYGFRIGFSPLKLVYLSKYNQFSIMGDLKINGLEQGFRYCRYNGFTDKYRFGAWMYEPDVEKSTNTYSGYELSYWLTLTKYTYEQLEQKICLEARAGVYRFESVNANIVNRELDYIQFYDNVVNPVGHRYDLSVVYRVTVFASDIFFIETNFSMGLGFRYLTSEFSNDTFIIDDVRYSDSRWPMITAPIRFGLRTGIRFF